MAKKFDFLYDRLLKKKQKPAQVELELPLAMPRPDIDGFEKKRDVEDPEEKRGVLIIPL